MDRFLKVLKLSWPIILSYLSYHVLGITDLLMVGRLGKDALAAVGIALTVFWLLAMPLEGFFDSSVILLSKAYGAGKLEEFKKYLYHELALAALAGLVGTIFYIPLSFGLTFLTASDAVLQQARSYLWITMIGLVLYSVNWVLTKFLMAIHENKKIALLSNFIVFINIGLNYILIFGKLGMPALGVTGAALASLLSRIIQFICLGIYSFELIKQLLKEIPKVSYDKSTVKEIIALGRPIAETNLMEIGSWTLFVGFISRLGVESMAAHEIAMKIKDVAFLPGLALAGVTTTLVGQSIGKDNEKEAREYCYTATWIAMMIMGSFSIVFLLGPNLLVGLFTKDKEVLKISTGILRIMAMYQVIDAVFIVFRGGLNGMGDTRFVRNIILIGGWVVMVPLAYVFTNILNFGVAGAWISLTLYVGLAGGVMLHRFITRDWGGIQEVTEGVAPQL